jgi:hypothetical protein
MKKLSFVFVILFTVHFFAQSTEYAFVYFKDKPGYNAFLANPLSELTQKALDRRTRLGIPLDSKDAPIEASYVEDVKTTLGLPKIKSQSKWLNGVAVEINSTQKALLLAKPYVASIESFAKTGAILGKRATINLDNTNKTINHKFGFQENIFSDQNINSNKTFKILTTYNYGTAYTQNNQVNITALHLNGYTGLGIAVAILDAGFPYVDQGKAYAHLRDNNRIKDTYNFVGEETISVYALPSFHGANVLGIMAGYLNDPTNSNTDNRYFVGAAPDADYYLYATEDADGNGGLDYPEEEMNFIRGLERADKMGVDIATASLGYYVYSDPRYDYTYNDMNGAKTFVARGANIAVDKGIILMNAMGNEGTDSWHYLISPADSPKVFSIGSVDSLGNASWFTSYGPNSINQTKPDAAAMGSSTYYTNSNYITTETGVSFGSGTSYATPIASGGVACLLQAIPNTVSRDLIKDKMRQTASLYPLSNDTKGFGILNFSSALTEINAALEVKNSSVQHLKIYPNPVKSSFSIITNENILSLELYDASGRNIKSLSSEKSQDLNQISKGIYFLKLKTEKGTSVEKIIKE